MTPDERMQLDAYAMLHGMDSEHVDAALARVGGDAATLLVGRAAVPAVAAWRAGDQDALDSALADLESALLLLDIDAIREE